MKRSGKAILEFQTYEEAARFFDAAETTQLEFESEAWQGFSTGRAGQRSKTVHVPVEIDKAQFRKLARRAKKQGTTPKESLVKIIGDALKAERAR